MPRPEPKVRINAVAALRKIKTQFPKTPQGELMFAIIEMAVKDLTNNTEHRTRIRGDAIRYLKGDMVHAQWCDVEPSWVRMVLKKCYVLP